MRSSRRTRFPRIQSLRKQPVRRPFLESLEDRCLLATNITQYHVDSQSTGANLTETQLTPLNVNASDFGQLYNTAVDGQVYAEPLVLTNVKITTGTSSTTYGSVVFVATQHDSLYAINSVTGSILWHRSFLDTSNPNDFLPGASSVTSIPSDDTNSDDIYPEVGITGTPVIDPSTNLIYLDTNTKEIVGGNVFYVQRLHAINVKDGTDAVSSFVIGSTTDNGTGYFNYNNTPVFVNGTGDGNVNGVVQFNALRENNRPALSLVNGQVYAEWASHGDNGPYHGWVVTWNVQHLSANGLALTGVFCTDPNGGEGGIWGGGGGLTFDPSETVNGQPAFYFETGNGDTRGGDPPLDANGFPADQNYYESLLKVVADPSTSVNNQNSNGWGLKVSDYFTPYNVNALDAADEDFGSGSPLVLPDSAGIPGHPHLIVAAGKEGKIYLVDRDNMGKFTHNADNVLNAVYDQNTGISTPPVLINGSLSTPAYYHGTLYWVPGYGSNAWSYVVAPIPNPNNLPHVPAAAIQPTSETANANFGYVPGSVMVTANGTEDPNGGIVWIMDLANGEIHAYSSLTLSTELWNSGGGSISGVKFAVPTIANGQVFVGTQNSLQAFGITGTPTPVRPPNTVTNLTATALSGTSAELTWTDTTVSPNFATSYTIMGTQGGGGFTTFGTASQQSTNFTVTGLNPNATYNFVIVSNNSAGSSAASTFVSVKTTSQTGQTPTPPLGLGATPASGSEAYLTWTNTATNQTGFTLTRATDSLFTQNVVTQTLASAPYYFTDAAAGMSPGHTYYYRLQATNSAGSSSFSNTSTVNIPNVPAAPTNASAVNNAGQVLVSWTDHAGPYALGYQISRSVDGGPYSIYANTPETSDRPPTTQSFTDTNIVLGHTYSYQIVAQNVAGFSAPANTSVSVLGTATLTLDAAGNLVYVAGPGVPDRLSVQYSAGVYTVTDSAVLITAGGAGASFVTGGGTSSVMIPAAKLSAISLDTGDDTDAISIITDVVPITITADSGGGTPTINLGDPTQNETISGQITNAGNGPIVIAGAGKTTVTGKLITQGSGGVLLGGSGTILITGNINLGQFGNLVDNGSGSATISGVISGASSSGLSTVPGLIGTYFNLTAASNQIEPAVSGNPAWLGNQAPAVTARLVGPIDFPDIADNGFLDNAGDPSYYNIGGGNNNVEARWYGNIIIPGTGTTPVPINFATASDDGSMIYIDGQEVVNNNYFQGVTQRTGLVNLTPGVHTIDIEFYQGGGGAVMLAQWDPSGGNNFVDIPNSAFSSIQAANGVTLTGTGTLTLTKTNTYTGPTTINGGTLIVSANGAMGQAAAAGVAVNPGGALALSGGVKYTNAEPISIRGNGPAGNGAIENLGGVNTLAGAITLLGGATIGTDAGGLTLGGGITSAGNPLAIIGAGSTTISGTIASQGGNVALAGSGVIKITGNINLGATGNLFDSSTGQDTITGIISGSATTGSSQGLVGTYFNLAAASNQIAPADPSNPAWLGNQVPAVTAPLVGPIDFPDIADFGFQDNQGDPNYYAVGVNVEARWYGDIMIPGTGSAPVPINFATTSDDGSMIYIDGQPVVNNNDFQGATQRTGIAMLTPGPHTIDIEYYQGYGGASMVAQWDTTGGNNFVDIPNSAFFVPVNEMLKTGGGTLTLSNTNTYSGATRIDAGTLVVTKTGALGPATAAGVFVQPGGALGISGGFNYTTAEPITINGSGPAGNGAIENLSGANLFVGNNIFLAGPAAIGSDAGSLRLTGNITNGPSSLTLLGGGSITINGKILGNGGNLYLASGGGITLAGSISFGPEGKLIDTSTGNDKITGIISGSAPSSVAKSGTGTLTLTNTNTYTGSTTVNAGQLVVDGKILKSSGVTVGAGGTLGGNGFVPTSAVQAGGVFAPGDGIGTLTATNLSLSAGASFQERLAGSAAGTQYDQTVIPAGGSAALNNAALSVVIPPSFTPAVGQQFTIIRNLGTAAIGGTFSQGSTFTANGYTFAVNYAGGAGRDVVLTVLGQTTTLVSSSLGSPPSAGVYGQSVTFTATVSANSPITGTPSGSVTFTDGSITLGTFPLVLGSASVTIPVLTVGAHNITASFSGTNNWLNSGGSLSQLVNKAATTTTLYSSRASTVFNQAVTFTATVSPNAPGAGTPSGLVTFMDGTVTLGSAALNGVLGNDQASLTTTALIAGNHNITAVYSPDPNFLGSASAALGQPVSATPQLQNGVLALPGTSANATITVSPAIPTGGTAYSLYVSYLVGTTTTRFGPFAVSNAVVYGNPATDSLLLKGTTGNDSFTAGNGSITENAGLITPFTVALNGILTTTINGYGGVDSLAGPNQANAWLINGKNAGVLNTTTLFQGITNLMGGTVSDVFKIAAGGSLLGNLAGAAPSTTLDYSLYGSPVTVNLQSATAKGITGTWSNITNFIGSGGNDTLTGPNTVGNWTVNGTNAGTVGSYAFSAFHNLTGGSGNDTFTFLPGGSVAGNIVAGLGVNTLDESQWGSPVTVNLQARTASGIGGMMSGFQTLIGTGTTDALIGLNSGGTWTINGPNAGTVSVYAFSGFPNLIGGPGNDGFKFVSPGLLSGSINGGGGTNTITGDNNGDAFTVNGVNSGLIATILPAGFSNIQSLLGGTGNDGFAFLAGGSLTAGINGGSGVNTLNDAGLGVPVTVNLQSKTATGIGTIWSNLQSFIGTGTSDKLIGTDTGLSWRITGSNVGTAGSFAFSGFSNLTGGAGNDTFKFVSGGTLSGAIDGQGGTNALDYSVFGSPVKVNLGNATTDLPNSSATGVNGGAANGIANISAVTVGSSDNYLTAAGVAGNVSFTATGNGSNILVGGAGSNTLSANGSGNNILIGGQGTAVLNGGTGYNLLIGGTTAYDAVLGDLEAILAIWKTVKSSSTYTAAITKLMSSTTAFPLTSATVHGNNTDTINARTHALDWYFAALASEIAGAKSGETDTQC